MRCVQKHITLGRHFCRGTECLSLKVCMGLYRLKAAMMHLLRTQVLSFPDVSLVFPTLLASPWRRHRLLRNPSVGSDESPALAMALCHVGTMPHPLCFKAKAGTLVFVSGGKTMPVSSHIRGEKVHHRSFQVLLLHLDFVLSPLCKTGKLRSSCLRPGGAASLIAFLLVTTLVASNVLIDFFFFP